MTNENENKLSFTVDDYEAQFIASCLSATVASMSGNIEVALEITLWQQQFISIFGKEKVNELITRFTDEAMKVWPDRFNLRSNRTQIDPSKAS